MDGTSKPTVKIWISMTSRKVEPSAALDTQEERKTMSVNELRKCIVASLFQPFTLNIADGRRIPVVGARLYSYPTRGRKNYGSLPAQR